MGDPDTVYENVKPNPDDRVRLMLTPRERLDRLAALIPPPYRHRPRTSASAPHLRGAGTQCPACGCEIISFLIRHRWYARSSCTWRSQCPRSVWRLPGTRCWGKGPMLGKARATHKISRRQTTNSISASTSNGRKRTTQSGLSGTACAIIELRFWHGFHSPCWHALPKSRLTTGILACVFHAIVTGDFRKA